MKNPWFRYIKYHAIMAERQGLIRKQEQFYQALIVFACLTGGALLFGIALLIG